MNLFLKIKFLLFYFRIRNQTTTLSDKPFLPSYYFTSELEIKPQPPAAATSAPVNYFTSELEIKPQLMNVVLLLISYYFTSELEIKPQPARSGAALAVHYFTSELEIKPQLYSLHNFCKKIILLQN